MNALKVIGLAVEPDYSHSQVHFISSLKEAHDLILRLKLGEKGVSNSNP